MKNIIGIDIGTSSVKILIFNENGIQKVREPYTEKAPDCWVNAVIRGLKSVDVSKAEAIGLSSQVGTYIINGTKVINWNDNIAQNELNVILNEIDTATFLNEISMCHPKIISYPLPRLKYITENIGNVKKVCMPKDMLLETMTGNFVSDKYSWRGICNLTSGKYSEALLKHIGCNSSVLPQIKEYNEIAGYVSKEFSEKTGIKQGTPVITGLNDFYSAVLGMGQLNIGQAFDITGTSEHLGIITNSVYKNNSDFVSSPFIKHNVLYGVTASSGVSLEFANKLEDITNLTADNFKSDLPVFLPYLNGERAPVWDRNAKGNYIGINGNTTKRDLAVSAAEGIALSLFHIYDSLGKPSVSNITVSGGGANFKLLNQLKATLFNCDIITLCQSDTSALGAVMCAALSQNGSIENTVKAFVKTQSVVKPVPEKRDILLQRYEIYKSLYPLLKSTFKKINSLEKKAEK